MKKILLFLSMILGEACKTAYITQNIQGHYYKTGRDYQYFLSLNDEKSFTFTQKYFEVTLTCIGKWQRLSKDTFLLKCNDEDIAGKLQSGYMATRGTLVIVLSKNKLKMGSGSTSITTELVIPLSSSS